MTFGRILQDFHRAHRARFGDPLALEVPGDGGPLVMIPRSGPKMNRSMFWSKGVDVWMGDGRGFLVDYLLMHFYAGLWTT